MFMEAINFVYLFRSADLPKRNGSTCARISEESMMLKTDLGTQADMALNLVDLARFPIADLDSGEVRRF